MKIQESTKKFWAGVLAFVLIMGANFVLFVGGHPCTGPVDFCSQIHYQNGTVGQVPKGQIPLVTKDARPLAFFDLPLVFFAWFLFTLYIMKQRKISAKDPDGPS